jgi:hypothetical protein
MVKRQNHTESGDKDAASGETAMERFRSLTRKLLHVQRAELEEERQRHNESADVRRLERGKPP